MVDALPKGYKLCAVCGTRAFRGSGAACPACRDKLGADVVEPAAPRSQRAFLDLKPLPKERPRCKTGKPFTTEKTAGFEETVAFMAGQTMQPYDGPVRVTLRMTGSHADIDNLAKSILDGLHDVAFANDKQVLELHCYLNRQGPPSIVIEVDELEPDHEAIQRAQAELRAQENTDE